MVKVGRYDYKKSTISGKKLMVVVNNKTIIAKKRIILEQLGNVVLLPTNFILNNFKSEPIEE